MILCDVLCQVYLQRAVQAGSALAAGLLGYQMVREGGPSLNADAFRVAKACHPRIYIYIYIYKYFIP